MSRALLATVGLGAVAAWIVGGADNYQLFVIALVGLTAIVGTGLNVLVGLSGQISLGHAAFYAIGAYTVGILTTRYGANFWVALPTAGVVAAVSSVALAIPALRVRGPYLAMITIAFGFVVEQGAAEWKGVTGGWNGLLGIEAPVLFGYEFRERDFALLVLALTVAVTVAYGRLAKGPWGMAMRAVRDSESAGQSVGLNPVVLRAVAFGLSAGAAGVAGGIFASMSNFISPESFPFLQSILFLLVVMVGGTERVLGPLVGAFVVILLPELLSSLAQYRLLFVGLLLFVVLRLAPDGIVGLVETLLPARALPKVPVAPFDVAAFLAQRGGESLVVDGVAISFGGVKAVQDVTFAAAPGRITSVIGPNGAGKSTVLNLVCGFYAADRGAVRLGQRDLTRMPSHRIAQAGVARTYQTTQLFPSMTVIDNILVGLRVGHLPIAGLLGSGDDARAIALAHGLLGFVGFTGDPARLAGALAHVDKRLVELARGLALAPRFLVLDEPAAGLGEEDTARLGDLLQRIASLGVGVVLVEHDMDLVMAVSTHIVVLDAGRKIAEGAPEDIKRDPLVRAAYLGEGVGTERRRTGEVAAGPALLSVRGLAAGYGPIGVLDDLSLEVRQGEMVAVLGANGAGKTTLMRALTGLVRPTAGQIVFDGADMTQWPSSGIAATGLVLVPEGRQVFPELSVVDNLRLGAFARPTADREARIAGLLERFPRLAERKGQRAGLLSGGEQQMLAIARGLMARPRVLLLDEPSLGLAPLLVEQLYDTLAEIRDEGQTILLVDQMAALALSVVDRAYVLGSGRIVAQGTGAEIAGNAELARAYLGVQELTVG